MAQEGTSEQPAAPTEHPCSTKQCPDAAPLALLDLPAPWLEQLTAALGPRILPLFRSCRALRDLVLSQRGVLLEFRLPQTPAQRAAARAKLLLAGKYSTNVQLTLAGRPGGMAPNSARMLMSTSMGAGAAAGIAAGAAAAAVGQAFGAITAVTVENMHLHVLVSDWLPSTCPNMRRLCVRRCQVTSRVGSIACPQLKELHLSHTIVDVVACKQQLLDLIGLNSLRVDGALGTTPGFMECLSGAVGSRLTQLSLPSLQDSLPSQLSLLSLHAAQAGLQQLAAWLPCVRDLQLPHVVVSDEGMEALLSLGSLRKLQCKGFQLEHSYTHRPCPWTHLGFTELDVASFERLPLEGGVHFTRVRVSKIIPSLDLGINARVAAAVVLCGFQGGSYVHVDNREVRASTACLEALLPMLSTCKVEQFTVSHARPVTPELLAVMRRHLSAGSRLWRVEFCECEFNPAVWRVLLPRLPRAVRLVILSESVGMFEADLYEMCVPAARPVRVNVMDSGHQGQGLNDGWQERVQAAMMEAPGHQHVRFYGSCWKLQGGARGGLWYPTRDSDDA